MPDDPSSTCSLCNREVPPRLITLHHLKPKQKGGKAEDRAPMCPTCHKQLHAVFSNTQLARGYATLEALKAAPQLAPFLAWIRKQKTDRNFRTDMSNAHPKRRRKGRKFR